MFDPPESSPQKRAILLWLGKLLVRSPLVPLTVKLGLGRPVPLDVEGVSTFMLQPPARLGGRFAKGVLVLNQVDQILQRLPALKSLFLLIERKGWYGPNQSVMADIKLVEDSSTLALTRRYSHRNILLEISGGDFVDEQVFRPLGSELEFDVIQIACWSRRKRIELLIDAAALLPAVKFVHFGHFENGGSAEELKYRDALIARARRDAPNIYFPFTGTEDSEARPQDKETVNAWINRARIGLLTTHLEGHPRFKMECFAADRPMLIPADTTVPTRKFLTPQTGRTFEPNPTALAAAITAMLKDLPAFSPREHILRHSGRTHTLQQLRTALGSLASRGIPPSHYHRVDWDGRNQNLKWGDTGLKFLANLVDRYRPLLPLWHHQRWRR